MASSSPAPSGENDQPSPAINGNDAGNDSVSGDDTDDNTSVDITGGDNGDDSSSGDDSTSGDDTDDSTSVDITGGDNDDDSISVDITGGDNDDETTSIDITGSDNDDDSTSVDITGDENTGGNDAGDEVTSGDNIGVGDNISGNNTGGDDYSSGDNSVSNNTGGDTGDEVTSGHNTSGENTGGGDNTGGENGQPSVAINGFGDDFDVEKEEEREKKTVMLRTKDNKLVEMEEGAAKLSGVLRRQIEEGFVGDAIPVDVKKKTLKRVRIYCDVHSPWAAWCEEVKTGFDDELAKTFSFDIRFFMFQAAICLEITGLVDLLGESLAAKMSGKSVDELLSMIKEDNELTPEEEEQVIKDLQRIVG